MDGNTLATRPLAPDRSQATALARKLRSTILDGRFPLQVPLPSHRTLAGRYRVGVQVVRSALSILENEGLITSHERRGTFIRTDAATVAVPPDASPLRCVNFFERPTGTLPGYVRTCYLQGYTEALEHCDVRMRIMPSSADESSWDHLFSPNFPFAQQGCVLINLTSAPLMRWLTERQIPFVLQNNRAYPAHELPPHHSVFINKFYGGYEAVEHLIQLGHRRIGYIGPTDSEELSHCDVYGGYRAALARHGILPRPDDVMTFNGVDAALLVEPIRRFIDRADKPTAIFASNDAQALGLLEAARQLKLRVPRDLSVVGYDDLPESAKSQPPLTTVANPRTWLGRAAVEMLFELSAGRLAEPQRRALEGTLVQRASTAPPR